MIFTLTIEAPEVPADDAEDFLPVRLREIAFQIGECGERDGARQDDVNDVRTTWTVNE